ncbi:hypothetical protein HID58_024087 [Brassica napus]|uniref:SEC12-like protein 2 n=1 Tax=Brassica napus TaxID=3708 RepID=A0ABQ8D3Z2_BRANA|nr:hypothetical protein HID58_024087 [Brassica napus]
MTERRGGAMANTQTYGFPIYAADWIAEDTVRSKIDKENSEDCIEPSASRSCIALAGGGGEGRSGIPNVIVICRVDLETNSLLEQPVGRVVVSGLPYRMAVHPREGGLICALPESCKRFDWENIMRPREGEELEEVINELEDVGQQLALEFNQEGSLLATGGEDGTLRIFEWPSMITILNESKAHGEVKNLTFSESGKFLVSLGGPLCRVWDVNASTAVASLSKEKLLKNYSITAFNVSPDGKFLAFGTLEGDVLIISSTKMKTHQFVKKAHLGLVTALTFSPDSRCLVSVSFDSRAKLTVIEKNQNPETNGINWLVVFLLFVLLVVVLYYFLMVNGIIAS